MLGVETQSSIFLQLFDLHINQQWEIEKTFSYSHEVIMKSCIFRPFISSAEENLFLAFRVFTIRMRDVSSTLMASSFRAGER